ncbi:MAG: hypothetical protein NVS2B4_04530 [Ramlibacter sp.]
MPQRLLHRLLTIFMVIVALLFSQLALATHACAGAEHGQSMGAMQMAPGAPCEGMDNVGDPVQPALCHQHCADAPQASDPMTAPVASLPAIVQVLVVPLLLDAIDAGARLPASAARARPPPDPPFLSTLRLRV